MTEKKEFVRKGGGVILWEVWPSHMCMHACTPHTHTPEIFHCSPLTAVRGRGLTFPLQSVVGLGPLLLEGE